MNDTRWVRELQKAARAITPNAEYGRGKKHLHFVITGPRGARKVFVSASASDYRTIENFKREVRKVAKAVGVAA